MKHTLTTLALAAAALAASGVAGAQQTQTPTSHPMTTSSVQQNGPRADIPANLHGQARISEATARATAMSKVPGGTIQAAELEREGGKLLYSYDIKVTGKSGIQEVQINALDGSVIGVEHESPAAVAKEAAADRKASLRKHADKHEDAKEGRSTPDKQ